MAATFLFYLLPLFSLEATQPVEAVAEQAPLPACPAAEAEVPAKVLWRVNFLQVTKNIAIVMVVLNQYWSGWDDKWPGTLHNTNHRIFHGECLFHRILFQRVRMRLTISMLFFVLL